MPALRFAKFVCNFFVVCYFVFGSSIYAQQQKANDVGGILVSPAFSDTSVRAGQKTKLTFTVANPGQVPSNLRLKILPYLPAEWSYQAQYAVTYPQDASSWFTERDLTINLASGAKKSLQFAVSVPARTSGSFWCVLQCDAKPANSTSSASILIDVPVLFTVGRSVRPQLKVSSPTIEKEFANVDNSRILARFPVENEGQGYASVGVVGKLKDAQSGRLIHTFERSKLTVFPATKRSIRIISPSLPDGNYVLDFRAQLGSRLLPAVTSRYVVIDGVPKPETEATIMELPPLTFEPSGISLVVPGGSMRSQSLRISNLSERPITVDITPKSLEQASSGVLGLGSDTLPTGLTATVTPSSLTIRPKTTASVRVLLKADKEAQGDLWFGLAVAERGNANTLAETVNGSVFVDGTAKPMMEVVGGNVDIVNGRPLGVRFTVRNTGNQALQLVPSAAVLENGIRLVARLEVPSLGSSGILPSVELSNLVMLPADLKPGDYITEISYQYGEDLYAKLRVPVKVEDEKAPAEAATAAINAPTKPKANVTKASPTKPALAKTVSKSPVAKTKPKKP